MKKAAQSMALMSLLASGVAIATEQKVDEVTFGNFDTSESQIARGNDNGSGVCIPRCQDDVNTWKIISEAPEQKDLRFGQAIANATEKAKA